MMKQTSGIHHITAIVGDPQENIDFYAGVLGLRFVKKTVNFDDPGTYHFYFGDEAGNPGTIITFFPWANAHRGVIGDGQVGVTAYAVPKGALPFWERRLEKLNISYTKTERFNEEILQFDDPHGLRLELVEREDGKLNEWVIGDITPEVAIKGFAGATLYSYRPQATAKLLEKMMGLEKVGEEKGLIRFRSSAEIGNVIDIKTNPTGRGMMGVGTVHHIAWRAKDEQDQLEWQELVAKSGIGVTDVNDRKYFKSIYFREYGGILFEIATDPPGFAVDEPPSEFGSKLMLPPWLEPKRDVLESILPPVEVWVQEGEQS